MSRIIAGTAKGRTLIVPKSGTRPTSDRVRESLFSILNSRIDWDGVRVLDLFAGSGALGLEALSRGASYVVLVDNASPAIAAITKNVKVLEFVDSVDVVRADALASLNNQAIQGRYSLVFLDPPYDVPNNLVEGLVKKMVDVGLLEDGALIVVERAARGDAIELDAKTLQVVLERKYGDTQVTITQFNGSTP